MEINKLIDEMIQMISKNTSYEMISKKQEHCFDILYDFFKTVLKDYTNYSTDFTKNIYDAFILFNNLAEEKNKKMIDLLKEIKKYFSI